MSDRIPAFILYDPVDPTKPIGIEEGQDGDSTPVAFGGTGANDAANARINLGLTEADIKSRYESNADTNEFDDDEKAKLAEIEEDAELNTVSNLDPGSSDAQAFAAKVSSDFTFRTFIAGTNVSITQDANHITVSVPHGSGSGLDADTLDGTEGTSYLNTDNHTDGTVNKVFSAIEQAEVAVNTAHASGPHAPAAAEENVVDSVHGRTGDIVAVAGDYDASEVGNDSGVSGTYVSDALDALAALITGGATYIGGYNANTNTPDLDTSPSGISQGDMYTVTAAGTFFATALEIGDVLISEKDNPTLEADWSVVNKDLDAASIKASYESNADTNALTDDLLTDIGNNETHTLSAHAPSNAEANQTASELLTEIKTVDGTGSGLDADLLDGVEYSAIAGLISTNEGRIDTLDADAITQDVAIALNTLKDANATHTGDVTGDGALTIAAAAVTLAKMADMATASLLGRNTAGTGTPEVLSAATVRALLNVADGADVKPTLTKSITVQPPGDSENIGIFYTPVAITIVELAVAITGSTSVTWTLHHHTDRSNAGNKVITASTVTSSTSGTTITSFDDATIPLGSYVWFETSSLSGTPTEFHMTMEYTED